MLKKLRKLVHLVQAARYGHPPHKPGKGKKKWRRHGYGRYDHYGPPPGAGYGYGPPPYGHGRPRGLKGLILEAVLRRLFGHR
jgi:hypothetical protein